MSKAIHSIHSVANDGSSVTCKLFDLGAVIPRYKGHVVVHDAYGEIIQHDNYEGHYKEQLVELMCELTVQLILILEDNPVFNSKRLVLPGVDRLAA